jgi:AhpD family alkylhydroperoxidase
MHQRLNWALAAPNAVKAMQALGRVAHESGLESSLLDLVMLRASQINHCGYCVDMHSKDARARGETEQRLFLVSVWEDAGCFNERERAALLWTEAVTNVTDGFVPDAVYDRVRPQFTEAELVNLTVAIVAINGFNRLNVSFRIAAGGYRPAVATPVSTRTEGPPAD